MSRFAAIEARATQSPACTNDVVWLVERIRQLRAVLQRIALDLEVEDAHASYWDDLSAALAALDEPNLPQ